MATTGTAWAFDLGKGSIGAFASPRWGESGHSPDEVNTFPNDNFLHGASLLIPAGLSEKKKGLKLSLAPVQELRLLSGSSFDLRSQADRFLRTADPQVLISEKK